MKNYQWVKEEIEKLLTAKVICSNRSSWSAPNKILHPEIDPLVEEGIKVEIEEITIIGTIIDQFIEIDQEADGITIGQVIGVIITQITIDEVIRDQITDKTPNGLLETEVRVGIEMRIIITTIIEVEVEIEILGEEKNLGPILTLG